MPRVFFGNFDFEHELAEPARWPGRSGSPPRPRLAPWLATAWLGIAEADDVIFVDGAVDYTPLATLHEAGLTLPSLIRRRSELQRPSQFEFVPWGWSRCTRDWAKAQGFHHDSPPLEVVADVNRRSFRHALEHEFGTPLSEMATIASLDELERLLAERDPTRPGWLLKADYGMAGRGSVRGTGRELTEPLRNWARARLASVGPIVFEPAVEPLGEAGIQLEIPRAGPPRLIGVSELIVDRSGTYRGSRFETQADPSEAALARPSPVAEAPAAVERGQAKPAVTLCRTAGQSWQPAIDIAQRVAQRLKERGYFGPLGIDAMWYRDEAGKPALRPLQDLNARFTMGRLALGFRRIVPAGWCASWLHLSWPSRAAPGERLHFDGRNREDLAIDDRLTALASQWSDKARIVRTSPSTASGTRLRQSLLVMAATPGIRDEVEAALHALET